MHTAFIAVDTETSALSCRHGGRVIEVAAVRVVQGEIVDEFSSLINTATPISASAYRVHGISSDMLVGQPAPQQVWTHFQQFVGSTPLVAHNAPFDRTIIGNELASLGTTLRNAWHCTVAMARLRLPSLPNHRLETIYRHYFGELPPFVSTHRALTDARMVARIWGHWKNLFNE